MSKGPLLPELHRGEGSWLGLQGRDLASRLQHIVGSLRGDAANGTNGAERRGIRLPLRITPPPTDGKIHNTSFFKFDVVFMWAQ